MELCVYQGTFNPIHNAHIRIAEYTLKKYSKDGIIFIPAYIPPHKDYDGLLAYHRLNMVKLAAENNPKFYVSDIEYKREGKSYTYLTICQLYEIYKLNKKIKFIIGTDAFNKIESWYETDKLKKIVDFLVYPRENEFNEKELYRLKLNGYNYEIIPLKFNDISSTQIRDFVKQNKSIQGLVPDKVEEYILKNGLYKD